MKFLKIFLIVFILTISSFSFAGAAFREPTSDLDFVSAPVTSLSPGQIKIGSLNLSWLSVLGDLTTGYVGIGGDANNANSIPQEKLDVQGSVNIHNQIKLGGVAPNNGQVLHFGYDDITGSPKMRWGGNYAFVNFTSDVKNGACVLDGICDSANGETCGSCPGDCTVTYPESCDVASELKTGPVCPNAICEAEEDNIVSPKYCPQDCILPPPKFPNYWGGFIRLPTIGPGPGPVTWCGNGKLESPNSNGQTEQCDPPFTPACPYVPPGTCVSLPSCDANCQNSTVHCCGGIPDTVPPNLGGGGDTTPPGGGSGVCKNNSPTGAPQCGGTCPKPGETCQDNNGGSPGGLCQCLGDITVPAPVTTLSSSNITSSSITLNWTSTGDDLFSGTATSYDIRYSTSPITNGNFNTKTQVSNPPAPLIAGTPQSVVVGGLLSNTTYYFAMKVLDEVPNTSLISNIINATTLSQTDSIPPGQILSLRGINIGTTVNLSWTAPGDDSYSGTATSYDIRYSTTPITSANFNTKTQVSNPPTPQVAGTLQSELVTGLSNNTIYYFAMKTSDEVPNVSLMSNAIQIEVGSGGGSTPAFNGSNHKNPFASLFETFKIKTTEKAKAQSGGTCGDTWLPLNCYTPWSEYSLICADNMWIRSCAKEQ